MSEEELCERIFQTEQKNIKLEEEIENLKKNKIDYTISYNEGYNESDRLWKNKILEIINELEDLNVDPKVIEKLEGLFKKEN